jgi:tetratricopeptide (TPR) repeat protein
MANGKAEASREAWKQTIALGPKGHGQWVATVQGHYRAGHYRAGHYRAGHYRAVVHLCDTALDVNADDTVALAFKGDALRLAKRHEEAVAAYERLVELRPDAAAGWRYLGECLEKLKRRDEATAAWERAAALDASFAPPKGVGRLLKRIAG